MEKIFITTQTGQKVEVGAIRLFKYNETVFFIYTLSEKDSNNYIKLYVTKVNMSNLQSVVISDENEWILFKEVMKSIIKNNRNNEALEIIDLDPKTIENITVYDPKVFKLSEEMTNFLQMNVKLANSVGEVAPLEPQSTVPSVFDTVIPTNTVEPTTINNTTVDVSSLSGDISTNPEPAGAVNEISNTVQSANNSVVTNEIGDTNDSQNQLGTNESNLVNNDGVESNLQVETTVGEQNTSDSAADTIDYKVAYLEEQLKVETLNTKIATLEAQIKLLEQKIQQIKNVIE